RLRSLLWQPSNEAPRSRIFPRRRRRGPTRQESGQDPKVRRPAVSPPPSWRPGITERILHVRSFSSAPPSEREMGRGIDAPEQNSSEQDFPVRIGHLKIPRNPCFVKRNSVGPRHIFVIRQASASFVRFET